MSDSEFHQRKVNPEEVEEEGVAEEIKPLQRDPNDFPMPGKQNVSPLDRVKNDQKMAMDSEAAPQFSGQLPPQLQRRLQEGGDGNEGLTPPRQNPLMQQSPQRNTPQRNVPQENFQDEPSLAAPSNKNPNPQNLRVTGSDKLEELLSRVDGSKTYDEVVLPSRGVAYGSALPEGILHIRPMTGEEENILATPKYVRTGVAMNMIFQRVIKEDIDPSLLLTADRTFLLIYLRGRSFTTNYEVELRCPDCNNQFENIIDLNLDIAIEDCPLDFDVNNLHGVLPQTGLNFNYRLSTGRDELELQKHRESSGKSADAFDDTLAFRSAQLLLDVEGLTDKREIQVLLQKLPVGDVSHLRNIVNNPPFGVNTRIGVSCPMCLSEFEVDMPMETNFFFPRRK